MIVLDVRDAHALACRLSRWAIIPMPAPCRRFRRLRGWLRRWTHTHSGQGRTAHLGDIDHALRVRARRRKGWR